MGALPIDPGAAAARKGAHRAGSMRILFIVAGLGAGGAERVISLISSEWVARGWDVILVAFDGDSPVYHAFDPRVRLRRLAIRPRRGWRKFLVPLRRVGAIWRVLRDERPDLAISFLTKINVLTLAAGLASPCRIAVAERNNPLEQPKSWAWMLLFRLLLRRADAVIMQTQASLVCLPAVARARAVVIHNPIAAPRDRREPRQREPVLTAVGRLEAQKGFDLLIDAFAEVAQRHPAWTLVLWGQGPLKADLQARIAAHGLSDRIRMPGLSATPGGWAADAAAFVLSSRYEGFGNALGEAMAYGLPVAAFDCPFGPREMISDGESGLLVPNGDVRALALALDRLMGDPRLRERLGAAARDEAKRFAAPTIIAQWDRLVTRTVGRPAP